MKRKNSTTRREPFACDKIAVVLLNRLTGVPIPMESRGSTSLPETQSVLLIGVTKDLPDGEYCRIAIYDYVDGEARISKCVNVHSRVPDLSGIVGLGTKSMSERAGVNWVMGALFSASTPGLYGPECAIGPMSLSNMSSERRWQACVDLFDENSSSWPNPSSQISIPRAFNLYWPESAMSCLGKEGGTAMSVHHLDRREFKGHCLGKLFWGLRHVDPTSRSHIKSALLSTVRAFDNAVDTQSSQRIISVAATELSSVCGRLTTKSSDLISETSGDKSGSVPNMQQSVSEALSLMSLYSGSVRDPRAPIQMLAITKTVEDVSRLEQKLAKVPKTSATSGIPIQVSSGTPFTGLFPSDPEKFGSLHNKKENHSV